jgi:hypothetical protein
MIELVSPHAWRHLLATGVGSLCRPAAGLLHPDEAQEKPCIMPLTLDDLKEVARLAEDLLRHLRRRTLDVPAARESACHLAAAIEYGPAAIVPLQTDIYGSSGHPTGERRPTGDWGPERLTASTPTNGYMPRGELRIAVAMGVLQSVADALAVALLRVRRLPAVLMRGDDLSHTITALVRLLDELGIHAPGDGPQREGVFRIEGQSIAGFTPTQLQLLEYLWDAGRYPKRSFSDIQKELGWYVEPSTLRSHFNNMLKRLKTCKSIKWEHSAAKGVMWIRPQKKSV